MSATPLTRLLVADALGIAPAAVTPNHVAAYGRGWMDTGASCVNYRPGRATAPAFAAGGAYRVAWASEPQGGNR